MADVGGGEAFRLDGSSPAVGYVPAGPLTAAVKQEIERELNAFIPPGQSAAVLFLMDKQGPRIGFAGRTESGWQVAADAGVNWGGEFTGKVVVGKTW